MNEIEKLKNSLSMTTKEFAEHFGIPYNTVRQWVNGERKCPEYVISMLQKLIEYKTQGKQLSIEGLDFKFNRGMATFENGRLTNCRLFEINENQDLWYGNNYGDTQIKFDLVITEVIRK